MVNNTPVKPKYVLRVGDTVSFTLSAPVPSTPTQTAPLPSIPIIFEDEHVVVVDKPAGVAMYPGDGAETGTLAHWFSEHYPSAGLIGGDPRRPGIVHRLDKDTSGVVILAKTDKAFAALSKQFTNRTAYKEYIALVFGVPGENKGRITRPIARSKRNPMRRTIDEQTGRPAITHWKKLQSFGNKFALLAVHPLTGRMHQIRVHMHFLGFPIVGDQLYTFKRQQQPQGAQRHLLHAEKLTIEIPEKGKKTFVAPMPSDFQQVIDHLSQSSS